MIKFRCTHCRVALKVSEAKAGAFITCPGCKKQVTVPTSAPQPEMAMFDDSAEVNKGHIQHGESSQTRDKTFRRMPGWVWWGVLPGAGIALILLVVIVVFLMGKSRPSDLIVGSWVDGSGKFREQIIFNSDGSADLGGSDRSVRFVRYRFINDNTIQVTSALESHITFPMRVTFPSKDEMQLVGPAGGGTLRRVR